MNIINKKQITVEIPNIRLDKFISEHTDISRSHSQKLIKEGNITVNVETATPSYKTKIGDVINITIPEPEGITPSNIPLNIIFEDEHLMVINKPAGMVVHPAAGNTEDTLVNSLLARECPLSDIGGEERRGIVHRLDKDTSGLILVAKTNEAHEKLSAQLADRTMSRKYLALVWGIPNCSGASTIEANIGRHPKHRKKMAVVKEGGKPAVTHYSVKQVFYGAVSLVECSLKTGRTHQIRVHMTHIGHPVVGDKTYGRPPKLYANQLPEDVKNELVNFPRQFLHAYKLEFIHPISGEKQKFEIELSDDLVEKTKDIII